MKRTERTTNQPHPVHRDINIMVGSILSVHVIDARDLVSSSGGLANAQVRLKIEKQSSKTQVVQSTNDPVWNEVIAFDINDGKDSLKLIIEDVQGSSREVIGQCEIDLKSLANRNDMRGTSVDVIGDQG